MREDSDPDLTATLGLPGNRPTSRLDLTAGDALVTQTLQAIVTKGETIATGRYAVIATFEGFAILGSFW